MPDAKSSTPSAQRPEWAPEFGQTSGPSFTPLLLGTTWPE